MAVEKNAVREGTRWDYRGQIVVVEEVTDKSVIFFNEQSCRSEVAKLEGFLARASDPLRAEHTRLISGLRYRSHGLPPDDPTGTVLTLLREAVVHLLERMPPTLPPYVEAAPPVPKAEPLPISAIIAPTNACSVSGDVCLAEDCAVAMPTEAPAVGDYTIEEYDRVRGDFEALEDGYSSRKKARVR